MKHQNLGCLFIWPTECVEETDFGQLMISSLNEIGNSLWCNYIGSKLNQFGVISLEFIFGNN